MARRHCDGAATDCLAALAAERVEAREVRRGDVVDGVAPQRDAQDGAERLKDQLRDREKETSASHFLRLREGTARSIETSSIHLDTIRDLKQINSLLASMAYPVLEERGLLTGSRLKAS